MNLILLRHATRSTYDLTDSPEGSPLNAVGLAQAQDFAVAKGLPPPTRLFASPKLRARQTLEPLAHSSHVALEILPELDERRETESRSAFDNRVRSVLERIPREGSVYLCTHLDVLEVASVLWPTDYTDREAQMPWSTLEYQIFEWAEGLLKSRTRSRIEPRGTR